MPRSIPMNNYQLIEHIKIRRALWDNSLWDRIDSAAREVMWEDIAEQMKCTKEIIKARWKNLKDSYRKLLVKTMNQSTETIPKWRYYSHLEFIKNIILNTKSKVNDISLRDDSLFSNQDYIIQIENGDENESQDPLALSSDYDDVKVNISKKRRYSDEVEIEYEKPDSPERNTSSYPNDDDLQFLLSLYPHFKQVPHNKKLPLRIKIEKMIYDELYK